MSYKNKIDTFVGDNLIEKIYKKILILLKCKYAFSLLRRNQVSIYDIETAKFYLDLFKNINYEIIDTRLKVIYIRYLPKALIRKLSYRNLTLKQCYLIEQIKHINPKYLISFTNVDIFFWTLKEYLPDTKLLIFQTGAINGHLPNSFSSFEKTYNKKFHLDYVFTWGKNLFKKYKKYLDCELISSGSLLNNSFINKRNKIKKKREIVFISQYKRYGGYLRTNDNKIVSQKKTFHEQRKYLLKIISDFCKKNNFVIKIYPRAYDLEGWNYEKNYYAKLIKNTKFPLIKRSKKNGIYECLSDYNNFITIDSSSGYEALARGKRVCFLNIKYSFSRFLNAENHRYGWPERFPKNHAFWSASHKKKSIERALRQTFLSSEKIWKKNKKKYVDPIISYDPLNKKLLKKLHSIGLKLHNKK